MDFQGFQNTFPDVIIVVAICALLVISWLSYRKSENIPPLPRWGLTTLRALTLIILFLLLMNPYFYSSREVEKKPKIAVFLDNSESVGISRGNYDGMESYRSLLQTLNFEEMDAADLEYYSIGTNTAAFHPDTLTLSEQQTNLSSTLNTILELEEDVKAAIILSDGIITYGKNPAYNASFSSIPLHTIALGDTSKVRDISISNILTNSTGYTNTNHMVEAEISQSGFEDHTITVQLSSGDEILAEKQVSFETDDQVKKIDFELELKEEGLQQYEIITEQLDGEWTHSNNKKSFSIDVIDSKVKILHIAFSIHPDVKTVRTIINEDINNELTTLTWLGDNQFVEDTPEEMDFDLVFLHGTPNQNIQFDFLENLSSTPLLLFNTNSSDDAFTRDFSLIESDVDNLIRISLHQLLSADEQPVLELPSIDLNNTPLLTSTRRTASTDPQSVPLFSMNYNNTETEYPVISILEQGNLRRGHVYSWGWFKLYQSTNSREFTTALFTNLVSWTSSNPDDRKLQISPTKQTFSTAESPAIQASLQNESGEKEAGAIIEIEILSENNTSRSFNMENAGNGNYSLDLPRLSEGIYKYEATARKGNREIDQQSGEFMVSNSSSELSNTRRNDQLLRSISSNSGGEFFTYNEVNGFWDSLKTTQALETQTETIENYKFPVRSLFWFIIVLLLLGTEWLVRKYYSLP